MLMAKKEIKSYVYTDDLTGEEISEEESSTIEFSYAGQDYSIDLGAKNAKKLDEFLAPYLDKATKVRRGGFKATGKRGKVPSAEIRVWGLTLPDEDRARLFPSERGALRKEAIQAYNDTHGTSY